MTVTWLILAMAVGVYSLRIAGFLLPENAIPQEWEQALQFVPITLISALTIITLTASNSASDAAPRLAAAAGAALVVYRTRKMWTCIASGMGLYWLLGLV